MRSLPEAAVLPLPRYPTRRPLRSRLEALPWGPWLSLLALALLVKLAIVGVALAILGTAPDPFTALASQWVHWDAPHYLSIAAAGYARSGDLRNLIAFFPLYPALIQALGVSGLPLWLAAIVLNNAGGLLATVLLYEVARTEASDPAAFRAAVLFNVFPTAYFLFNGYTEGVFCAFAFAAVLAARRERWPLAGALGGLATATRLTGLALVPFLAIEVWTARHRIRRLSRALVAAVLPGGGLLVYLAVNWLVLGDALAFVQVQRDHWYHRLSAPWVGLVEAARGIAWRTPWERITVGAGEVIGGVIVYVATALTALKLRPADAVYAAVVTVLTTFLPFWLSIPRYLLALFPLFLLLGRIRSLALQVAMTAVFTTCLLILSVAFARGYWAF